MSFLLLNIVLHIVMREALAEELGIWWGLGMLPEDIDSADDICLMSHIYMEMSKKNIDRVV